MSDRPLIVFIVGTRPEAIKMAPIVRAIAEGEHLSQQLIFTGQHEEVLESFDLPSGAIEHLQLNLKEQTAGEIRETVHHALCRHLARHRPDMVLVQGDTSSALAGALAARDCDIPIGHVEAGLRSGDPLQPWPEEGNRVRIDAIADILFAPTEAAAANLASEADVRGAIHVTGNSGIDALLHARTSCPPMRSSRGRKMVLVTCHRRENRGELERIAEALKRLVRELPLEIVFLLHPNPHLQRIVKRLLGGETDIALLAPVGHQQMVCLMDSAWLLLTDSGGIQEEGPALGKPVLVLRNVTERGEAVSSDNVELIGTTPARIFAAVSLLMEDEDRYERMSRPSFPFGDGRAAPRIARIIEEYLASRPRKLAPLTLIRN